MNASTSFEMRGFDVNQKMHRGWALPVFGQSTLPPVRNPWLYDGRLVKRDLSAPLTS